MSVRSEFPKGLMGWTTEVQGDSFTASHPSLGTLRFGYREEDGFVGWVWEENSGGGSVVVPHFRDDAGEMYIGIVKEKRTLLPGGFGWNLPRGFVEKHETHLEAAKREMFEETGSQVLRMEELPGDAGNPNSSFFDTRTGGIRFFSTSISRQDVIEHTSQDIVPIGKVYRFKDGIFNPTNKLGEKILQCMFVPWKKVATGNCTLSSAGVLRLLAHTGL